MNRSKGNGTYFVLNVVIHDRMLYGLILKKSVSETRLDKSQGKEIEFLWSY